MSAGGEDVFGWGIRGCMWGWHGCLGLVWGEKRAKEDEDRGEIHGHGEDRLAGVGAQCGGNLGEIGMLT